MSVTLQPNVGDFKLLSRQVIDACLKLHEPLPFIRGIIAYVGFKSVTIEYERDRRFAGETHFPVFSRRVISNFINNALIGYSDLPIHIIIYLSLCGILLAFFLTTYVLYLKFAGLAVPGSAGVILTVTVFSSLIIFSVGILGMYLSSIKRAVLRRPQYLVESIFDSTQ